MEVESSEDNYDIFGLHVKILEGEEKNKQQKFFTVSYKGQNVDENEKFIEWKKTKKLNELLIICPECGTYFTNNFIDKCKCPRCEHIFCKGCFKEDCDICFKGLFISLKSILNYIYTKVLGNHKIWEQIIMYFFMLFQLWFSYPLQFIYYFGPMISDKSGVNIIYNDKYRRKGLIFFLSMIPYQIAFFGIYFTYLTFFLSLLFILYPPFNIYIIGLMWYIKKELFINNRNLSDFEDIFSEELL